MEPKHLGALALILFGGYFYSAISEFCQFPYLLAPRPDCPGTSRSLPSELETKTHSQ